MNIRNRLYLATVGTDAAQLAQKHGLGLELDEFCTASNMDADFPTWDAVVRTQMRSATRFVFHAPFAELSPCAIDPLILEVVHRRLCQAAEIALGYGIKRMIVHSGFIPRVYFAEWYIERASKFFRELLKELPSDFQLLIENVLDDDPHTLAQTLQEIDDPRAGICLDVGHAHVASSHPVVTWIDTLSPWIRHIHLHDNCGDIDAHAIPGMGTIGFPDMLEHILQTLPTATITSECLDSAGFVNWMIENRYIDEPQKIPCTPS